MIKTYCSLAHALHSPWQYAARNPREPFSAAPRPAARAARSRSQRGGPRAAAHPAESNPAAAAVAAVEELRQLLTRPRPNKQLVQKQLQVVEADFVALAAQKDAALVAAQKDAALAQKDAALAQKDLEALVRDFLDIQGILSPRGLLEFAESRLFAPLSLEAKQDRRSKWEQLGRRHPDLQERILVANPAWKAHFIAEKAVQLYSRLSAQAHSGDVGRTGKVLLVEGPLTREDMRFLECLAQAVHCPCELRYKQLPAAVEQGEQLAASSDGE